MLAISRGRDRSPWWVLTFIEVHCEGWTGAGPRVELHHLQGQLLRSRLVLGTFCLSMAHDHFLGDFPAVFSFQIPISALRTPAPPAPPHAGSEKATLASRHSPSPAWPGLHPEPSQGRAAAPGPGCRTPFLRPIHADEPLSRITQ